MKSRNILLYTSAKARKARAGISTDPNPYMDRNMYMNKSGSAGTPKQLYGTQQDKKPRYGADNYNKKPLLEGVPTMSDNLQTAEMAGYATTKPDLLANSVKSAVTAAPQIIGDVAKNSLTNDISKKLVTDSLTKEVPKTLFKGGVDAAGNAVKSGMGKALAAKVDISAGAQAGIGLVGQLGGAAIGSATNDDDPTTWSKKEALGNIGKNVLTAAATTFATTANPIITAGVAAITVITSLAQNKKSREESEKLTAIRAANDTNEASSLIRKKDALNDTNISNRVRNTGRGTNLDLGYGTSIMGRAGLKFAPFKFTESTARGRLQVTNLPPKKFKRGGKVKMTENIIPNGVLHEEKNSLGDKGMPVVKCTKDVCEKQYEIERDEMILTLGTTKKMEVLAKGKKFAALGAFVREEILHNTHSFTDKYKFLNTHSTADETIFA